MKAENRYCDRHSSGQVTPGCNSERFYGLFSGRANMKRLMIAAAAMTAGVALADVSSANIVG